MGETWRAVFGHDEPYPEQADGIETAIETAERDGFAVIEGACGTGKTMLALTAGIDRVRDPDSSFERVVVLTSVKQQLRQFEADVRTINENLPDDWRPVSALTLVGKADVCPYSRERVGNIDESTVYDRCEGLRERTRNLTGSEGPTTAATLASEARQAQTGLLDSGGAASAGPDYLETAGEPTPYLPDTAEYGDTEYCPFYAQYLDDLPEDGDPVEAVPFDFEDAGLLDTEDLVGLAAGHGTCPHSMLGALLPHVEVVIGNYYHAFDPRTVDSFTGALLDESTFVVCDEAHMLEPRVRDLVSDGVADATLRDAESELTRVIQPLEFDPDSRDSALVRGELEETEVSLTELKETRAFVRDLREELDRRVRAHLDREHPAWRTALDDLPDDEIPLRDPETPEPDAITEWAEGRYGDDVWVRAETVAAVVARVLNELEEEDRERAAPTVGRVLGAWYRADHGRYFRAIDLSRTWNESEPADSWRRAYNARLSLHNCVPGDAIASRLGDFGGGVLMSATLEPLDVFRTVTGLDDLEDAGRPVVERTYGLTFPAENRASFAVDAPAFTHENRGAPGSASEARQVYVDAVAEVAGREGNVLVGMPNYAEAEWMAGELEARLDTPVLLDESSDDGATEALKSDFFAGGSKTLVTSLRGTLTEGVDYRGDRLHAAVVCGVPLVDTTRPRTRAVVTAYDRAFGSDGRGGRSGFETALTVPAVRKARQAVGRVIRGPDERGVRVLVDARYARDRWNGVREYFPEWEREEFQPVSPDMLSLGLDRFE
ncbi:ATP-dependent DNA helicase [Haloplanus aerogenes]|uniref:ATP-dependent DNA helicase n=1 Tax=Haloplanus aerogenes TaxID=660522 RepID=A0A3M0D9T6_9EURY|nr:ATP-dependent DNA helicase [Haloplanus aerogenes]AZH26421.1 ATP-dependent DNA helicase [Haloplanus aerogenes]RMB18115.1 DNA excision repair protein ERCC-2 [Haloplanus aerogenes]